MTSTFEKTNDIIKCKLILENNTEFIIPMREDGYIFATALCKIAGKMIGNWLKLKETKELVKKLENSDILIITSQKLVEIYKGNTSKYNQGTWIHPDLGIQLAQWCSPSFAVQVSKWVREIVITGKVEIGKEKSNEELLSELEKIKALLQEQVQITEDLSNKNKELETQFDNKNKELGFLENKINRFQKRQSYPDKNVLYIVTCDELKKDRIFIIGKAVDLKIRLTSYNKSIEHEMVYYKNFKNMYHMKTAEMMVLYKLNQYKNEIKDRFILPENEDISLFINVINNAFNWFEHIENIVVDNSQSDEDDKFLPRKKNMFDRNSVYMLTSDIHLKKRTYIIGKTKNLSSRLTAYNKGIDHQVVYNKKCKNIYQMGIIEQMILYKLDVFRERANRDRFILPEDKDISFFIKIFDEAIAWFDEIDPKLEIKKDIETIKEERSDSKRNYRQLNIEKVKEMDKNYKKNNKSKIIVNHKIYRESHKKQISDGKKDWYNRNKDNVINRVKNNYNKNRDEKLSKVKEYASKNQDKIKARQAITMTCECGSVFKKYGIKKHLQTVVHQEYLKILESIHTEFTNEEVSS